MIGGVAMARIFCGVFGLALLVASAAVSGEGARAKHQVRDAGVLLENLPPEPPRPYVRGGGGRFGGVRRSAARGGVVGGNGALFHSEMQALANSSTPNEK